MEDTPGSRMELSDLPIEMLAKVLVQLDRNADRKRAMEVNSLWAEVIDEMVGVRMSIGSGSEFWTPYDITTKWYPLVDINNHGIYRACFSDVRTEPQQIPHFETFGFKLPNLLKHLEFDGYISERVLYQLLKPLRFLETIGFHISTMGLLSLKPLLHRPNVIRTLKKVKVTSEGIRTHHYQIYDMERVFQGLMTLLDLTFPSLSTLHLVIPMFLDKEIELFSSMVKFCLRHGRTLRDILIKTVYSWRVGDRSFAQRGRGEIFGVNHALDNINWEELMGSGYPEVPNRLNSLRLIFEERETIYPTSLGFKAMLMQQTRLESMTYLCWDFITLPQELIIRNCGTLHEIALTVNDIENGPVDCAVFSQCSVLRKLNLEADGDTEFEDLAEAPRILNVEGLPPSLRSLQLRNVYMESSSADWILRELQLQTVFLMNIGKVEDLGMTIPTLLWVLKESTSVTRLKVKGLNDLSYREHFGEWNDILDSSLNSSILPGDLQEVNEEWEREDLEVVGVGIQEQVQDDFVQLGAFGEDQPFEETDSKFPEGLEHSAYLEQYIAPEGLEQYVAPEGLEQSLDPVGLEQSIAPEGLEQYVAPEGLEQSLDPVGLEQSLDPVGLEQSLAPEGLEQSLAPELDLKQTNEEVNADPVKCDGGPCEIVFDTAPCPHDPIDLGKCEPPPPPVELISEEDKALLTLLMEETNYKTKYIPYITKKRSGSWVKRYPSTPLQPPPPPPIIQH